MSTSKLSPRFVDKEVKTVESVRDGATLNLTDEARMLVALVGKTGGAGLREVYSALIREYRDDTYKAVSAFDGKPLPTIHIKAA
ncbi:Uncharacterised protein [Burkholderia pseudomallei]|uniref:hypothetical protein n=1 Tax=Burkholderia pseudomallei TaxID=28450 RepID=UPI0009C78EBC|nr:hypothetical protein [Burkholderia pseudomallei]OMR30847.1 hypothetical protein AQ720_00945 [Burkholderia pseudomallei]CAJ3081312.1 Uncharacterised protein [Burkholderia pseudomallei]CAJ3380819.1 Uncharacterised protein [Burkholderia pseudomallei]CAJ5972791.1 Uncharacterised protein [Burkholderia pseudomallei]CAJ6045014.1 Uncharacterised protein [Burkholderia pseudomallei]